MGRDHVEEPPRCGIGADAGEQTFPASTQIFGGRHQVTDLVG